MNLEAVRKFHAGRIGYLIFAIVELALAYLFLSLAINSGSLSEWALGIILVIGGLHNLTMLIWKVVRP